MDLTSVCDLNAVLDSICKIGNLTIINDYVVVWLDDDKEKSHLHRCLKKCGITEFYCESVEYDDINKNDSFDYLSTWFLDNYKTFSMRKIEKEKQKVLHEMYENVQRANALLDKVIASANSDRSETMASMTKVINKEEA